MSFRNLSISFAALAAFSFLSFGQTFRGGVAGTVTDSTGASVAGASVQLTGTDTGLTRSVESGGNGEFAFQDLPLGRYAVLVNASGFQKVDIRNISVEAGKTFNLVAKLEVASQATTVQVEASSVAIETSSSSITSVIPTKIITDVPLNGRDFTQLLKLNPGVNSKGSLNGTRTNSINWQIDGADNNDQWHNSAAVNQGGVGGIAGTLLPIDAIDQFSLQSNSDAESGRNGGGVLNLVIKSGTNDYHGSLYYFDRNEFLTARNYFLPSTSRVQKFRNHQPGGSLGGPIWKNHTFFFLTYEQQNLKSGGTAQGTTPSAAWVNLGTSLLAARGVAVNPVSRRLINGYWPADSLTGPAVQNNFNANGDTLSDSYNGIVKLDHIINERNNVSFRYFGGTGQQTATAGSAIPYYYQVAPSRMHNFSAVYNFVISPKFVGQTMAGVNYFKQVFNDSFTGLNSASLGLNTGLSNSFLYGAPNITISGFEPIGVTAPLGRIDTTGHLNQTFTYTAGSHQIRFGGEYRRARFDVFYQQNARGTFAFDGSQGPVAGSDTWNTAAFTGAANPSLNSLADFLSGRVGATNSSIIYGDRQRNYYFNSTSGFIADSWKVKPNLTLNYGVNWIFQSPLSDPTNRISTFIPSKGGITYPGQGIDTLYPRDWNNFAPRFGFAYQPFGGNRIVVRGGYGLFYQVPNVNYFGDNRPGNNGATGVLSNPGGASPVYTLSNQNPYTIQDGALVFGNATLPSGPFGLFSVNQNFLTGYVHNFNLNTQFQVTSSTVLEVGYTGSLSRKLPVTLDINQRPIGATDSARPYFAQFPNFRTINEVSSAGNGYYNGAIASLRTANYHGVTTKLNYTFGHSRDDLSATRGTIPQNSYCLRCEYSDSDFDIRHTFAGYIGYELPSPERFKAILGGWQLNSLLSFSSGPPFTVNAGRNTSGTGQNKDRAQLVGDPFANVPANTATARYWFNPAAFALPANNTYGNLGRNALRGPGVSQVDFSVFKNTSITERVKVQLRVDMFNLFNSLVLPLPTASVTSTGNGRITQTLDSSNSAPGLGTGAPRNVQLGVKLIF